jgi:beta-N-acetylhexosaminidase
MLSCSLGIRQPKLDGDVRAFLREAQPWSLILFREACVTRAQVSALCADLRDAVGRDSTIWIDQEGGRVTRLKPPEWPTWPPAAFYGDIYARDAAAGLEAARLGYRLIAHELKAMGVDCDFAPVLDLAIAGADKVVVGDRAFAKTGEAIAALGRAALEGLHAGGVAGSIKHMPGHGRAMMDSHFALPRVSASETELVLDAAPFTALADAEAGVTAHIVYDSWDKQRPATCSPLVIGEIIRGRIGFKGLLMSDDLDMKALQFAIEGGLKERAEAALAAGCDVVLQCSGALKEMEAAAAGSRPLSGAALARARAVEAIAKRPPGEFDAGAGWTRFRELLKQTNID